MASARDSITAMIQGQDNLLLRQGQLASERYDQIRQRHIWSTFYFTAGFAGSVIDANSVLQTGEYTLFSATVAQNGQGLPNGFFMTDLSTNFPGTGRVADDQNFIVWELGVSFLPMRPDIVEASVGAMSPNSPAPLDVDALADDVQISVRYLTNEVNYGRCALYAQPGGPSITGGSNLDTSGSTQANIGQVKGGQAEDPGRQARFAQNTGPIAAMPATRRKLDVPIYLQAKQTFAFKLLVSRPRQLLTLAQGGTRGFACRVDWWAVESFREQG